MSTSKEYIAYIKQQLSGLGNVTYRQMMGEYIVYYKGKIAAYVCDNTLLAKDVKSAREYLPEVILQSPYEGAKPMLAVENTDDGEFLSGLFEAMYEELPKPKAKKKKS